MKKRALEAVLGAPWAMTAEYCELVADIAAREAEFSGNLEALEAKLGRKLGNTERTSMRDSVAVIPIEGPLFPKANLMTEFSGATSYAMLALDFDAALNDPQVEAIVLKIDSPGGAVTGASEFAQHVAAARGTKRVVAYVGGSCASAAYWIASAADEIIAADTALIGSIGVQMGLSIQDPRPGQKAYRFVSSQSPMKNADPGSEAGSQEIQRTVDALADVFLEALAANLGTTKENVAQSFGQGSVFVASEAKKRGMIDGIGTFEGVLSNLKKEAESMDYKSLTAASLADNRPDIVAALRAEGAASVEKVDATALRAEAVKAERERITALEALAMPGAENLITQFKADGTEPAMAAVKIVQHMKAQGEASNSNALKNIKGSESGMTPPKSLQAGGEGSGDPAADPIDALMASARAAGAIR